LGFAAGIEVNQHRSRSDGPGLEGKSAQGDFIETIEVHVETPEKRKEREKTSSE